MIDLETMNMVYYLESGFYAVKGIANIFLNKTRRTYLEEADRELEEARIRTFPRNITGKTDSSVNPVDLTKTLDGNLELQRIGHAEAELSDAARKRKELADRFESTQRVVENCSLLPTPLDFIAGLGYTGYRKLRR